MIDPKYEILSDSTKEVNVDAVLVGGRPVTLNAAGEVVAADDTTSVLGLSKVEKNQYRDDTYGEVGAYGSRRATVMIQGIANVYPSNFSASDLDEEVELAVYDDVEVPNGSPMDNLYADADGLLTTVVPASPAASAVVGKMLKVPTADDPVLQVLLS